jgi:peptide deformylase
MIEGFVLRGKTGDLKCYESNDGKTIVIRRSDGRTKIVRHELNSYNHVLFDGYIEKNKKLEVILKLIQEKT